MPQQLTAYGRAIKKMLIDRNMTQIDLCRQIGCNEDYLLKICKGLRSGEKYGEAIYEILGVPYVPYQTERGA
jgi:transcriptional regulator with XRE-family HTH domain